MKAVLEVPGGPAEVDVAGQINKKGITLRGVFGRRWWDTWEEILLLVSSGGASTCRGWSPTACRSRTPSRVLLRST